MRKIIKFNFINTLLHQNGTKIVFFQKNTVSKLREDTIAWKVIESFNETPYCFNFPLNLSLSVTDSFGNVSQPITIEDGRVYHASRNLSGIYIEEVGKATRPDEFEVLNKLTKGTIKLNIFRDGKLLASKENFYSNEKLVFQFNSSLWVGVISHVVEGEKMNSAIISKLSTELNLSGLVSATVVLKQKKLSSDIMFALEDAVYE